MTEPEHEPKENPQDFLGDLQAPLYDLVEKGNKHNDKDKETRDQDR